MAIKTKIAVGFAMIIALIMSDLTQLLGNGPIGPNDETRINPFDIYPSELEQTVEYDAESDSYIIYEKIGDEYFRSPTTMTFNEYLDWRAKQQEKQYFNKLAGIGDRYKSASGRMDPMSKIDIEKNLIDRLFGGNGITIETQGTLDLNFGARYTKEHNGIFQILV